MAAMTEEYQSQPDIGRRNLISKMRSDQIFRRCVFCEFVRDITEFEDLEPKDEEMVLLHLKQGHGFNK